MECPRCGGSIEEYVFDGRKAATCVSCGWLGVPVEHRSEKQERESWAEALGRFRQSNSEATTDEPTSATDSEQDLESAIVRVTEPSQTNGDV
ncbi:MAG: hypothetical protein PPP58_05515 [Natronomonas sp.]